MKKTERHQRDTINSAGAIAGFGILLCMFSIGILGYELPSTLKAISFIQCTPHGFYIRFNLHSFIATFFFINIWGGLLLYISGLGVTCDRKWARKLLLVTLYGITAYRFIIFTAAELTYIRDLIIQRRVSPGNIAVLIAAFGIFSFASYASWTTAGKVKRFD